MKLPDLPIRGVLPDVADALSANKPVVLQAPPGTGKTLLTAPFLMNEPWLEGRKIILLEPRRLAARMAASSMSRLVDDRVGGLIGYQVRLEHCVSDKTKIEILTEGLLVQRLLHDPELADVGLIIFDEFHERSIHADFGLALTLDMRAVLRPDLRIIVMSATLDAEGVANHLGDDCRIVRATARTWPIETRYLSNSPGMVPIHEVAASGILRAIRETDGGILAFLPGEGEIRHTEQLLLKAALPSDVDIYPLYGALSREMQDRAVAPSLSGRRKVVLSTSIAESSLTIQDIKVVVDSGWSRVSRFSPYNGMSRLETVRVTRDRADQRRGRAGRLCPGVCYRLWDEQTDGALLPEALPEILDADLAPVRLQAALWGASERSALPWPTEPPESAWRLAGELLHSLDALDDNRIITERGRRLCKISAHPRLAHMIDHAAEVGAAREAALCAAVVEEAASETKLRFENDIRRLVMRLKGDLDLAGETRLPRDWVERVRKLSNAWSRAFPKNDSASCDVGRMLSWAFPDRIAQKRDNNGLFRMVGGHGARVAIESGFAGESMIVVAEMQDSGADGLVRLAAPVDPSDIEADFASQIKVEDICKWDRRSDRVVALRRKRLGAIVFSDAQLPSPPSDKAFSALLEGIRLHGVSNLGWTPESRNLQARILFLRRILPASGWQDVSDEALEGNLEEFFEGWLDGVRRWEDILRIDLLPLLDAYVGHRQREIDKLAPTTWILPCGHRARIRYDQGETPVISAKLQDFFGVSSTPMLAGGIAPVKITLLSPAQRPVAVTDDLASFWKTGYPLVRKEMRGRYPKHNWPENPF